MKRKGETPMKTAIGCIQEHFNTMSDITRKFLNKPNAVNLELAINSIYYLEGLAFAAIMAHKESESDADLAAAMSDDAKLLRQRYYEIKLGK